MAARSTEHKNLFVAFHRLAYVYVHLGNCSILHLREHKMAYISNGKESKDTLNATLRRVVKYSCRYEIFTSKRGMFSTWTLWPSHLLPWNQIHSPGRYLESSSNWVYSATCQNHPILRILPANQIICLESFSQEKKILSINTFNWLINFFYIFLTVCLSIILASDQLNAQIPFL
jgi:hypothetical protein